MFWSTTIVVSFKLKTNKMRLYRKLVASNLVIEIRIVNSVNNFMSNMKMMSCAIRNRKNE